MYEWRSAGAKFEPNLSSFHTHSRISSHTTFSSVRAHTSVSGGILRGNSWLKSSDIHEYGEVYSKQAQGREDRKGGEQGKEVTEGRRCKNGE